jgi:hypothetical protein
VVPANSLVGIGPSNGTIAWDVDGDGFSDFALAAVSSSDSITRTATIALTSAGRNGGGWMAANSATAEISKLAYSAPVGPGEVFGVSNVGFNGRQLLYMQAEIGAFPGPLSLFPGLNPAFEIGGSENYAGFRFAISGNPHYGWARFDITTSGSFIIAEAYYNTTPNAGVLVGVTIPEPTTTGLGLLALGTAGLAAWRRRKTA